MVFVGKSRVRNTCLGNSHLGKSRLGNRHRTSYKQLVGYICVVKGWKVAGIILNCSHTQKQNILQFQYPFFSKCTNDNLKKIGAVWTKAIVDETLLESSKATVKIKFKLNETQTTAFISALDENENQSFPDECAAVLKVASTLQVKKFCSFMQSFKVWPQLERKFVLKCIL
jgi:hypothetical protein